MNTHGIRLKPVSLVALKVTVAALRQRRMNSLGGRMSSEHCSESRVSEPPPRPRPEGQGVGAQVPWKQIDHKGAYMLFPRCGKATKSK